MSTPTAAARSRPAPAATFGHRAGAGAGATGAGSAGAGAGAVTAGRFGRPSPISDVRSTSDALYQPPSVLVSRTFCPGARCVTGPPAAYGQTNCRTRSSVPAPLGNVQVIVYRGPRWAAGVVAAATAPGAPSSNSRAHMPAFSARVDRSVPLPGSPSPFMEMGPPGRPPGPPPEMVAADAPLAWAAVGTMASRRARASVARAARRDMGGLLPGVRALPCSTPRRRPGFPGRSAPVDEHRRPHRQLGVPAVHGRDGDADAAVAGRERRDRVGAVQGIAADEVGRPPEQAELARAPAVDLVLDGEAAQRGHGQ